MYTVNYNLQKAIFHSFINSLISKYLVIKVTEEKTVISCHPFYVSFWSDQEEEKDELTFSEAGGIYEYSLIILFH
jgi:hypothetical protein